VEYDLTLLLAGTSSIIRDCKIEFGGVILPREVISFNDIALFCKGFKLILLVWGSG
jgi:hypothetical protein